MEQKNYSVVRRAVGYARYDTPEQLRMSNELYSMLRLYTNFFRPVLKLVAKEHDGAKVKKTYDKPQTPCRRVLNSPTVGKDAKQALRTQYAKLTPAEPGRARIRQTALDEQAASQVGWG